VWSFMTMTIVCHLLPSPPMTHPSPFYLSLIIFICSLCRPLGDIIRGE